MPQQWEDDAEALVAKSVATGRFSGWGEGEEGAETGQRSDWTRGVCVCGDGSRLYHCILYPALISLILG